MSGILYLVATPIGNLDDLSIRAARILKSVDLVLCEDTRHSAKLLNHIGSKVPRLSLNEHNERRRLKKVLGELLDDKSIAMISDAGTPTISDPGYIVVREARASGISVSPIPGACAAICALSASGLPTDSFSFFGFPPESKGKRLTFFNEIKSSRSSLVLYLSPHKAVKQLNELAEVFGDRKAVLAREMTKIYEEFIEDDIVNLAKTITEKPPKGELVLIITGAKEAEPLDEAQLDQLVSKLVADGLYGKTLAEELQAQANISKKLAYNLSLKAKME